MVLSPLFPERPGKDHPSDYGQSDPIAYFSCLKYYIYIYDRREESSGVPIAGNSGRHLFYGLVCVRWLGDLYFGHPSDLLTGCTLICFNIVY